MKRFILLLFLIGCSVLLNAAYRPIKYVLPPSGKYKVLKVYDGDTFTILVPPDYTFSVRIQGIDAPEKKQEFGDSSRIYLLQLINNNEVEIIPIKIDRYGRPVVKCFNYKGQDIGLEMIKAGMAWYYSDYYKDYLYQDAELNARVLKKGLFSNPSPTRPKVFRKKN